MIELPRPIRDIARPHAGWWVLLLSLLLTIIGIAAIDTVDPGSADRQTRWLAISLVFMAICALPQPKLVGHMAYPMLVVSILLLVFVLLPFIPRSIVPVRNGARAWINLRLMMFQPSELAKISFVLALAWYLRYRSSYRTLRGLAVPFVIMFIPVGLILKEPDLGSALLFAPTLFVMLVAAGAKLRHMLSLVAVGMVVLSVNIAVIAYDPPHLERLGGQRRLPEALHILKPHQEARIAAMLYADRYQDREAYQQIVAKRLVAAGGFVGYGKQRAGDVIRFNRLPFDHNDMIFAVIVNRWGLAGALVVIGLYTGLVISIGAVSLRCKEPFSRMACVGFAGLIFTQASINIGVNIGLVPVTGITLPFISYGGSSLLGMFIIVGLVMNFASRRPGLITRPSFEFDHADAIFQ